MLLITTDKNIFYNFVCFRFELGLFLCKNTYVNNFFNAKMYIYTLKINLLNQGLAIIFVIINNINKKFFFIIKILYYNLPYHHSTLQKYNGMLNVKHNCEVKNKS